MITTKKKSDEEFEKGMHELARFRFPWSSSKYEDAVEHFLNAANQYKIDKDWKSVVLSYLKVAECMKGEKDYYRRGEAMVNASTYAMKYDINNSIKYLLEAIDCYSNAASIDILGTTYKKLALLYEQNADYEKTLECYEKYFDYSNTANTSDKIKVGDLYAQIGKYSDAIKKYEELAEISRLNRIYQYSILDILFKAGLCYLCMDDCVSLEKKLNDYSLSYPQMDNDRGYLLLKSLSLSYKSSDVDTFVSAIRQYETISKLDALKINLLLKAKNNIDIEDQLY